MTATYAGAWPPGRSASTIASVQRVVRHVADQRRIEPQDLGDGRDHVAPAPFLPPVRIDGQRHGVARADRRELLPGARRVAAAAVRGHGAGQELGRGHDVERHGGRVDARHPADHHAEVPDRLAGDEGEQRPSPGRCGWAPSIVGEPDACTPLATTAYSDGTVMRMVARGVVGDLRLRVPLGAAAEQPVQLRRHERDVAGLLEGAGAAAAPRPRPCWSASTATESSLMPWRSMRPW